MAVRFEAVKPGDYLYRVGTEIASNTTMRRATVREVQVASIDAKARIATTKGGKMLTQRDLSGMRRTPPEWLRFDVMSPRRCYFCRGTEPEHRSDCEHPKEEKRRAKATNPPHSGAQEG